MTVTAGSFKKQSKFEVIKKELEKKEKALKNNEVVKK